VSHIYNIHSFSLSFLLLLLRVYLGAMIFVHGFQKAFRGGKIAGTAGYFESIGMKPGKLNARLAVATEMGVGVLLVLGLLTTFASAGLVALMVVAIVTVHRKNGFFIYNSGVEYCLMIIVASLVSGTFGAGRFSLDRLIFHPSWVVKPSHALLITAILGVGGAALQMLAVYRPAPSAAD